MKNKRNRIAFLITVAVFGVVAWSPPSNEDVIVGSSNVFSSPAGQLAIIGNSNYVKADGTLVVGDSNDLTYGEAVSTKYSIVAGSGNFLNGGRARSIVGGYVNVVDAANSLVAGTNNEINYGSSGATNSCAIGGNNEVLAAHGYALGYYNEVSGAGNYGCAIGYGSWVSERSGAIAIGIYNSEMAEDDVFVIGTGASDTSRNTALRATADGSVVLGSPTSGKVVLARAQGDISMGQYSN